MRSAIMFASDTMLSRASGIGPRAMQRGIVTKTRITPSGTAKPSGATTSAGIGDTEEKLILTGIAEDGRVPP
jgi:hypothetical protein